MADILKENYSLSASESSLLLRVDFKVLEIILLLSLLLSLYNLVHMLASSCVHLNNILTLKDILQPYSTYVIFSLCFLDDSPSQYDSTIKAY